MREAAAASSSQERGQARGAYRAGAVMSLGPVQARRAARPQRVGPIFSSPCSPLLILFCDLSSSPSGMLSTTLGDVCSPHLAFGSLCSDATPRHRAMECTGRLGVLSVGCRQQPRVVSIWRGKDGVASECDAIANVCLGSSGIVICTPGICLA